MLWQQLLLVQGPSPALQSQQNKNVHTFTYLYTSINALFSAAPSAPPKTITLSSSSPRTLLISWSPPAEDTRNGNLSYYTIKVHEQATDVVLLLNSSSTNTQFTVNSLHPYYTYTVSVAAATIGLGPFSSSKFIRMPQAGTYTMVMHIVYL